MLDFIQHTPQMLSLLKRLVETESPSRDKVAVDRLGTIVAEESHRLGAEVEIISNTQTGNHVIARWGPKTQQGGILLLAHMDTVFPPGTLTKMPYYEKDGKAYGPGVLDMKCGIVIAFTAISALQQSGQMPPRPITALFTSDEEIGSPTSRALIESLARQSALVLVLEAAMPDGALKTWRKGVGDYTLCVRGRAAHAGSGHQEGRNAIEELAHQILAIQKMTDYSRGTTLNVGVVRGGTATNVVPDEATAEIDLRVMQPGEAERIQAALQALKPVLEGTSLELHGELNRPPMPFDDLMRATFEKAAAIAATIGLQLKAGGSGGGSDANFVAPLGIPVLDGLGAIGDGYHSEREYILIESLPRQTALLTALLRDW